MGFVVDSYKFLKIEKSLAYVLFDTNDFVYKIYNENELIKYLKTHKPK